MLKLELRMTLVLLALAMPGVGRADDTLRFASTEAGWDNSVAPYGVSVGTFKAAGIDLKVSFTDGSTATLQAIISGSVDIGIVAVPALIGAAVQGAPVTMVSSSFRGTSDLLWYARADGRIRSLKDVRPDTVLAYSTPGSSNYIVLAALLDQAGVTGRLVATGGAAATMTQVMTGQADVGPDGNGGLGVPEFVQGRVRPVAFGRDLAGMAEVSARGLVVNADTLAKRRDVVLRFLVAYQATIDRMYRDPGARQWFADANHASLADANRVIDEMYPPGAMRLGEVGGIDLSVAQGLQFKRIERTPSAAELGRMFQIVWRPPEP
ncbi:MAG: ABC transporter substrate-binding protein [Bauldia sp.]